MRHTVIVTGAGGFLGSEIFRVLAEDGGFEPVALGRPGARTPVAGGRSLSLDLAEPAGLGEALAEIRPFVVVHAAGRVQGTPLELFRDNTVATINLADAIVRAAPECRLVSLGSAAAYGPPSQAVAITEAGPHDPVSAYGHSKLAASRYLAAAHRQRGLRYDEPVVFNVVGERNSPAQAIGAFIAKATTHLRDARSEPIPMGPLGAVRDFVTAHDVAQVVRALLGRPPGNAPMNVCSGRGRRIRDLIGLLVEESGLPLTIEEQALPAGATGPDTVVGDPRLCLALLAPRPLASVDDTLRRAWRLAAAASSSPGAAGVVPAKGRSRTTGTDDPGERLLRA